MVNVTGRKIGKIRHRQAVEFQESYLGSGAQSRAIVGGFEAGIWRARIRFPDSDFANDIVARADRPVLVVRGDTEV